LIKIPGRADKTSNTATTIVKINKVFSKPLLEWKPELKLSLPPNEPPTPASDFCIRIVTISTNDRAIWIYGNIDIKVFIGRHSSTKTLKSQ